MNLCMKMAILILMTTIIMMMLMTMMSKKTINDMQKSTPFECGFNPTSKKRMPFSMHFFLIAMIFLIFDVEVIIIMPMILTMKTSMMKYWLTTNISFNTLLIMGLYHEWYNGMLEWTK